MSTITMFVFAFTPLYLNEGDGGIQRFSQQDQETGSHKNELVSGHKVKGSYFTVKSNMRLTPFVLTFSFFFLIR